MKKNSTTSPITGISSVNDTIWLKLLSFFGKKIFIALLVSTVLPFISYAGNVEKSVTFMAQSRALSLYVPNSYTPTLKYKLIVSLHGAGDNSVNFRNAISPISSNTGSPFYNCIIICPDGGSDPSKSFQLPVGDEEIIRVARDSAKKWYNIDTNYIYLNGFSLGARSALYYGLKYYSLWKGMFLWTPAVQSIAEADNKSYFKYSYSNANKIPICMTVGANDAGYVTKVQYIKNILVDSNGIVQLRVIAGLGHSIPPTFADDFCSGFVDNFFSSMSALDAGISKINDPKVYTCSSSIIPTVRLMNRGTTTLTSVVINYRIDNGTLQTHNWSGTLASLTSQNVTLPAITSATGKHALKVFTSNPNAGVDGNVSNDNVTDSVTIVITGRSLPQFDGFELQPTDVLDQLINPDGMYSYYLSTTAKTGTYSAYVPNFLYPVPGEKDDLITYPLNLSSAPNPVLTFDLAYVSRNSGWSDTLEVSISTDCGKTYTTIYKKFGLNLPTTSPTFKSTQFVPTVGQWRTESVSLGAYTSATTAFIRFRNICNYQNDLYLDNINIATGMVAGVSIAQTTGVNPTCAGASVTFTATPTNGGTTPSYQWKVNGVNVGTNSPTYTTTTLTNGQIVTCVMTSNLGGVVGSPATSTGITMTVNSSVTPAVAASITSGTNPACAGSSVTFTAAPTNGGTTPSYQWQVNGVNAGTNSATFTTSTLTNGQVVTCILTSNAACASPTTATSSGITMTINTVSAPAVAAAITSGANPGCAGASVTFTATPTNGGTTPAYQWKVNGVNAGTNSSTFTTTTLTNGQVVTCVLTSNAACASPTTVTSTGVTMTINPTVAPSVSSAITSGTNPACAGASLTFTATPANGGTTPAYQWQVNGVNVGTNSSTYTTTTLTNSQVVTCILTSNAACASPATATSTGITMTINPTVTPVVSAAITTGNNPTCAGASVTFTATPSNGGTTPAYQWKVNGVNAGTNSPTFTSTTLTNGQIVTCVLTSNAVCASPATATSTGITMSVSSVLTPAVTTAITSGTNPSCSGASVTFTATPTNGGTTPAYQWKVNGVNAGTNSATFTTSSLTNGQVVTCVLTSNSACASPTTATSTGITMTVSPTVPAGITTALTSGTNPSCAGASVTFTATPTNGGTTPAYQWKVNGVNAGTNSATFTSNTLTNGQVVTCVITSNSACASPTTATSTGITMTINPSVAPAVSASLTTGTNPACAGASLTFTAVPTNGGTTPAYQWKVNGVNVGTNSATFTTGTLTNGQVVTCVLTSNASCASPATATSTGITMTINAIPATPVISQAGSILTSSSASGNQWYLNGNPIPGATNQAYTVAQNGSYTVVVTTNGCSSAPSAPKVMSTVGVMQSISTSAFNAFPNPNDGNFTVSFIASDRSDYILELKNGLGQLIYREVLTDFAGTYSKQLNITEFGRGIYFVSLLNTRSEIVKKVMVY